MIFTQQKEYSGAILSLETDLVFMVTWFFCELLGIKQCRVNNVYK